MPELTPRTRNNLIAASALALATVTGVVLSTRDYNDATTAAIEDAGLTRHSGAVRMTDLLTGEVEPGATVVTGVSVPDGTTVLDVETSSNFEIIRHGVIAKRGAWLEVEARNTGSAASRFVGFVKFAVVEPVDAGVRTVREREFDDAGRRVYDANLDDADLVDAGR
jgi:hypothetical protein